MPVWLSTLLTDTILGVDLYLPGKAGDAPVLYRSADLPFTDENRRRLIESGHKFLLIEKVFRRRYFRYVEANLPLIIDSPRIPTHEKVQSIFHSANALVSDLFSHPTSAQLLERGSDFVENAANYMAERDSFHAMLRVMPAEYLITTHSVSVCGISAALGAVLGVEGKELIECALGAMLHDLGKAKIHPGILFSPSRLSREEMRIIRRHPLEGIAMLERAGPVSDAVRAVVLEHHEAFDGSGYPKGKHATEIHLFARVAHLADVFSALTANRPYARASSTFDAVSVMASEMKGHFDPVIFREFVKLLGK